MLEAAYTSHLQQCRCPHDASHQPAPSTTLSVLQKSLPPINALNCKRAQLPPTKTHSVFDANQCTLTKGNQLLNSPTACDTPNPHTSSAGSKAALGPPANREECLDAAPVSPVLQTHPTTALYISDYLSS